MKNRQIFRALSLLAALCIAAGCNQSAAEETTTTTAAQTNSAVTVMEAAKTTAAEDTEKTDPEISESIELEIDYVDEFGYTYYKNPTLWTTEKIFEELTINGDKFETPLNLEKLGEGYSHSTDGGFYDSKKRIACLRLMYNNKSLAWVYFDDCDSIDDTNKDYSAIVFSANDIEEEHINSVDINGIKLFSSYTELLNKMGTPAVDDGYNKNYTSDTKITKNHNFSYNEYDIKFYVLENEVLMISINI